MRSVAEILQSYEEVDAEGRHINGTDKHGANHHYGDAYESLFPDRTAVKLVMEIGVADGACLCAWREIFPSATIVGMDIHHSDRAHGERMEFHLGDQRLREDCERAAAGRQFDMIVEDATHHIDHTLLTLFWLWPFVKPGGLYVVEEWENVGSDRDRIRALWPHAEIIGTCGPHIADEPLVVFRKPTRCQMWPKGEQCGLEYGHAGKCKWGRGGGTRMTDIDARRAYWDNPANRAPREDHDLTDSMPYPFDVLDVEDWFAHKDVLEIGPGRGRQYAVLKGMAKSYSVCDISPAALAEPVFSGVADKYLLSDYADDFTARFDVVHFWYVLHHVVALEMCDFFAFVARHLHTGGTALFNSAQSGNAPDWYTGDGMGTTWMDRTMVRSTYSPHLETLDVYCQDERSSGDLFVTRKR